MKSTLHLHLRQLRFFAYHGLYEEEKKLGNEFELNIDVSFKPENEVVHHLDETINYTSVYELAKSEMGKPRELLETYLCELAAVLKRNFPAITALDITLYKLQIPLSNFEGRIGLSLKRKYKSN